MFHVRPAPCLRSPARERCLQPLLPLCCPKGLWRRLPKSLGIGEDENPVERRRGAIVGPEGVLKKKSKARGGKVGLRRAVLAYLVLAAMLSLLAPSTALLLPARSRPLRMSVDPAALLQPAAFFSAGLLVGGLSSRINPGGGRPLECIWVRPGTSRIGGVGLVCVQV